MRDISLDFTHEDKIEALGEALSSNTRIQILKLLVYNSYTIKELSNILNLAMSTTSFHVSILRKNGLVKIVASPNKKGNEKNISLNVEKTTIFFRGFKNEETTSCYFELPIGSYSNSNITPPCLINTKTNTITPIDNPVVFKSPERIKAQLISFTKGFLEYTILTEAFQRKKLNSIKISFELCSECPNFSNDWKSDITIWINDIELGDYRSYGDYGGRMGKYTPSWWPSTSSNFGNIVSIEINESGTYINGKEISSVALNHLNICANEYFTFKLGIKDDAKYVGGINLFGKNFGDYAQDIQIIVTYYK
jgi:predicted transcriptional regulator